MSRELIDAIQSFIDDPEPRNNRRWIQGECSGCGNGTGIKVYLRKEHFKELDCESRKALTIANYECDELDVTFALIAMVNAMNPFEVTVIETPAYTELVDHLLGLGWQTTNVNKNGVMGNMFFVKKNVAQIFAEDKYGHFEKYLTDWKDRDVSCGI